MSKTINPRCLQFHKFDGYVWSDDFTDVWIGDCHKLRGERITSQTLDGNNSQESQIVKWAGTCSEYLYFVSWSNDEGANGLIAEIGEAMTGDNSRWQVFATGINLDGRPPEPSQAMIEAQLQLANCKGWLPVTIGGKNGEENAGLFPAPKVNNISLDAHFIWYDSGNHLHPNAPFVGFNHDEFLIFRVPMKDVLGDKLCRNCPYPECDCDCGCGDCHGCNKNAEQQNQELQSRAEEKTQLTTPTGTESGSYLAPFPEKCKGRAIRPEVKLEPTFYFHWGDSPTDQIEEHDTEVFYLTVCNNFQDVQFKGFRITKVSLVPEQPLDSIHIVPDRFICLDCLEPCSCQTREFALLTRANDIAGNYSLEVEYCYEEICLVQEKKEGKTTFPLTIVED